ncbi:MAG: hypothetical protein WBE61_15305 [Nitrososphaeraceae archaeon]
MFIAISKGRRAENRIKEEGTRDYMHDFGISQKKEFSIYTLSEKHSRSLQVYLLIISVELEAYNGF